MMVNCRENISNNTNKQKKNNCLLFRHKQYQEYVLSALGLNIFVTLTIILMLKCLVVYVPCMLPQYTVSMY